MAFPLINLKKFGLGIAIATMLNLFVINFVQASEGGEAIAAGVIAGGGIIYLVIISIIFFAVFKKTNKYSLKLSILIAVILASLIVLVNFLFPPMFSLPLFAMVIAVFVTPFFFLTFIGFALLAGLTLIFAKIIKLEINIIKYALLSTFLMGLLLVGYNAFTYYGLSISNNKCMVIANTSVRFNCYRNLAITTKNDRYCDYIGQDPIIYQQDQQSRTNCLIDVARVSKNPLVCSNISPEVGSLGVVIDGYEIHEKRSAILAICYHEALRGSVYDKALRGSVLDDINSCNTVNNNSDKNACLDLIKGSRSYERSCKGLGLEECIDGLEKAKEVEVLMLKAKESKDESYCRQIEPRRLEPFWDADDCFYEVAKKKDNINDIDICMEINDADKKYGCYRNLRWSQVDLDCGVFSYDNKSCLELELLQRKALDAKDENMCYALDEYIAKLYGFNPYNLAIWIKSKNSQNVKVYSTNWCVSEIADLNNDKSICYKIPQESEMRDVCLSHFNN